MFIMVKLRDMDNMNIIRHDINIIPGVQSGLLIILTAEVYFPVSA